MWDKTVEDPTAIKKMKEMTAIATSQQQQNEYNNDDNNKMNTTTMGTAPNATNMTWQPRSRSGNWDKTVEETTANDRIGVGF